MYTPNYLKTSPVIFLLIFIPAIAFLLTSSSGFGADHRTLQMQSETASPPPVPPPPPPPRVPGQNENPGYQSRYQVSGNDTVYTSLPDMPQFKGGNDAFRTFKALNMKYPDKVKKLGIEGLVMVTFVIDKDGSVTDIKIIRGASPSLDAEAIRLTRHMPDWEPGKLNGKPVKCLYGTTYEFLLTPRPPVVHEEGAPFVVVEEMPQFPGGDSLLLDYIAKNTKYPDEEKDRGIQGRVIVRFCITSKGSIDRVTVLKGVSPALDAEAIRVVSTLPEFKPGKQGGEPVDVWYMVPITFALAENGEKAGSKVQPSQPPPPPPPPPAGYDKVPVFRGGEKALYKFIESHLVYPDKAREAAISGKVYIRFAINPDGSVGDVSVIKGINPEMDAEAIRVIKLLPAWKPGKLDGKPVIVSYPLTVTFTPE